MRSVFPVDFNNPEHRAIMFDCALANKEHLLNDYERDIILVINGLEEQWLAEYIDGFIAYVDDTPAGCFWVHKYMGVGRIRGGLFPQFKDTWNAVWFLKWLIKYGFERLELRKIEAELPLYSKHDRDSAAAERILKRIGFKKRTILPESMMIHGQPKDTILLDHLKKDYDVKRILPTGSPQTADTTRSA